MQVEIEKLPYIYHLSAFDLDRTLVKVTTCSPFFMELVRDGYCPKSSCLRALYYTVLHEYFNLSLTDLHKKVFNTFVKGRDVALLKDLARRFVYQHIDELIYPPTLAKLRHAQHMGHYTVILSNSPDFIVEPVAECLGVDDYRSTKYGSVNGIFSSVEDVMESDNKARQVDLLLAKLRLTPDQVTTYSDSILDLPFLMKSEHPVVVNPDRKLKAISLKKGWDII